MAEQPPVDHEAHASVAVALILDRDKQRMLWTWNPEWRAFSLPMTRIRPWDGQDGLVAGRVAAEHAAAEALGVPVVVLHGRTLEPILGRSGRDGQMRTYHMEVFRAEAHPRFAEHAQPQLPALWLAAHEVFSGEFRPLSANAIQVVSQLVQAGLLPGRHQLASTFIETHGSGEEIQFLMRRSADGQYFFPSKRRQPGEAAADAAERVLRDELGLPVDGMRPIDDNPVCFHERSESLETQTFYVHHLFRANLAEPTRPTGGELLAWVTLPEILAGQAKAGPIGRSARHIVSALGFL